MASDLDAARKTIEDRIVAQWVSAGSERTPIKWPNEKFTPPDDDTWIEPTILWGDGFAMTKGGRNQIPGVLNVNIYVPEGSGLITLTDMGDFVRDMVNRIEITGVRFGVPSGTRLIPSPDSKWAQGNVTTGFTVEEVVP